MLCEHQKDYVQSLIGCEYFLLKLWGFRHLGSEEMVVSSRKPGRAWSGTMQYSGFIIVLYVDKMELSQRTGTF